MDVDGFDVEEVVVHRQGDHLAAQDARPLLVPQGHVRRDLLVLIDLRLDLVGAEYQLLLRELVEDQLAETVAVAARGHPAVEVVLVAGGERQHQQELGLRLPRQGRHDESRLHALGQPGIPGEALGHVPDVLLVVEDGRVAHVEGTVDLGLDVEDEFRIAGMLADRGGHGLHGLEQLRKQVGVGLDDRVFGVEDIELGGAVVGIDGRLDRVANVVDAGTELADANRLRIGMGVRGRVTVQDPDQPTLLRDHHVRVRVPLDERRYMLQALADVAIDHHPAVFLGQAGEEDVVVALADGHRQARGDRMHREAAAARVVRRDVLVFLGVVELLLVGVHERRDARQLAVIDFGLLDPNIGGS